MLKWMSYNDLKNNPNIMFRKWYKIYKRNIKNVLINQILYPPANPP